MIFDAIWRLRRRRGRAAKEFAKEIRAARNAIERGRIEAQMRFELDRFDDDLRVALTRKLLISAHNLDVSVPDGRESWRQHQTIGDGFLIDEVRDGIKQQIRRERKERRDIWKDRLLLISGVIASMQLILSFAKALIGHAVKK